MAGHLAIPGLPPITDDDLQGILTHDRLRALADLSWPDQVLAVTEGLGRLDILAALDDSWAEFVSFGIALHARIRELVGVSLAEVSGLIELVGESSEAVEYECIRAGVRLRDLGTDRLSWRDLWVIVRCAPAGSPLAADIDPRAAWTTQDHLTALVFDAVRSLHWTTVGNPNLAPFGTVPRPGDPPRVSSVEHHRARAEHYARLEREQVNAALERGAP